MDSQNLKNIIEAALLAAANPLTIDQLRTLFGEDNPPEKQEIRETIQALREDYEGRGIEIRDVASGFRIQVRDEMSPWLAKLWEDRPPRYSRALVETLVIIAYRQPVTRGDVEEIRGVSVTTNIIRTLLERNWIKVVGHRDVPGKPAMFGTTRDFLDYFNLKKLDDLPPLAELASMDPVDLQLELGAPGIPVTEEDQNPAIETDVDSDPDAEDGLTEDAIAAEQSAELAETQVDSEGEDQDESSIAADQADVDEAAPQAELQDEDADSTDSDAEATDTVAAAEAEAFDQLDESDEADEVADVAPGAVAPLVGLNAPGEEPLESASVASLDEARVAAAGLKETMDAGDSAESDESAESEMASDNDQSAEVVPIKTS